MCASILLASKLVLILFVPEMATQSWPHNGHTMKWPLNFSRHPRDHLVLPVGMFRDMLWASACALERLLNVSFIIKRCQVCQGATLSGFVALQTKMNSHVTLCTGNEVMVGPEYCTAV